MSTLTLSPKFQLVIPKHIREAMQLRAGMAMQVLQYGDRIEFIPVQPMQAARGMLKGMDTDFEREDDRLPMADALIYATAILHRATIHTQDAHFEGLPQVRYTAKPQPT